MPKTNRQKQLEKIRKEATENFLKHFKEALDEWRKYEK